MSAWSKLTEGSTLPSGTAWQHLNAQQGGGGQTVYVEQMAGSLVDIALTASVSTDIFTANITDETFRANIASEILAGVVAEMDLSVELSSMDLACSITQMILSANIEEAPI